MATRLASRLRRARLAKPDAPHARTWLLSAAVLGVALLLLLVTPDATHALHEPGPWVVVIVFVGFIVSEPLVFHVEARNEAVSFSPSDIPLAVGVLMLSPVTLIAVRATAATLALIHFRRQPPFKLALNAAAFTLETVITIVVFRGLLALGVGLGPVLWVALIGALMAGLIAGGVTIATAISFFEGSFAARVKKEFSHSYLFYLPGAVLGASTAVPYLVAPWLIGVFVLPAPLVWLVLRSHGSLMHRFVDLSEIHAFSSHVGRSTQLEEIASTAVEEIAGHLRADTVALVVWGDTGRSAEAAIGNRKILEALPLSLEDVLSDLPSRGEPFTIDGESPGLVARSLRDIGIEHALLVVLGDESDAVGVLVVADRRGAVGDFDAHDLERLGPLAQQLTVALRKGQLHREIQHNALHDRLTGLPNRAYFDAWAGQHLERAGGRGCAALMIDLDRFKEVNDTLGHHAGDELLVEITGRLRDAAAPGDLVARFGGDEFAVFVPDVGAEEANVLAEVISEALERPVPLRGTTVAIAGSIGIAVSPEHGTDVPTLMRRADMAMYDAKRRHERAVTFRAELEGNDTIHLGLLGDLRDAIGGGTLEVHYQPQLDLRTGTVVSVEALARWRHSTRGFVPPDVFIPLAEQAGIMGRLTQYVLNQSLDAVRHWLDDGRRVGVAVNISAQSLVTDAFPVMVAEALTRTRVPPEMLTLEITERAMIGDSPRAIEIIEQLDQLGVRLSVDDFGTGYSSMVNLRHLPISELKIDRSFVADMLVGGNEEVLVNSAIALGHSLGMTVVAEGVETAEVEAKLRSAGCDLAQGYGIARPLDLESLDAFLQETSTYPAMDY